jgi:hypothetical protein
LPKGKRARVCKGEADLGNAKISEADRDIAGSAVSSVSGASYRPSATRVASHRVPAASHYCNRVYRLPGCGSALDGGDFVDEQAGIHAQNVQILNVDSLSVVEGNRDRERLAREGKGRRQLPRSSPGTTQVGSDTRGCATKTARISRDRNCNIVPRVARINVVTVRQRTSCPGNCTRVQSDCGRGGNATEERYQNAAKKSDHLYTQLDRLPVCTVVLWVLVIIIFLIGLGNIVADHPDHIDLSILK